MSEENAELTKLNKTLWEEMLVIKDEMRNFC
jgi:hypothetical protein